MKSCDETNSFSLLSDNHLIDCYLKSLELDMEPAFIELLELEMERRDIPVDFVKLGHPSYVFSS
ncbi:MAG TPA: sporulation histidine kinase inhibitor Sda [Bacilli bacterium]